MARGRPKGLTNAVEKEKGAKKQIKEKEQEGLVLEQTIKKSPIMNKEEAILHRLPSNCKYININMENLAIMLQNTFELVSDVSKVNLDTLKFKAKSNIDFSVDNTIERICQVGMPIFDYYIATQLIREGHVVDAEICEDMQPKDVTKVQKCLFYVYFNLVTRAKPFVGENEGIPAYIKNHIGLDMNPKDIEKYVTSNRIDTLDHRWIKSIKIEPLGSALSQRFSKGIAGSRHTSIFRDYQWKAAINTKEVGICEILREIAVKGPFWEQHPFFTPDNLKGVSISKNIENLICNVFDDETIKLMVKNKSLFKYPSNDQKYTAWRQWNSDTFSDYKTPVIIRKESDS